MLAGGISQINCYHAGSMDTHGRAWYTTSRSQEYQRARACRRHCSGWYISSGGFLFTRNRVDWLLALYTVVNKRNPEPIESRKKYKACGNAGLFLLLAGQCEWCVHAGSSSSILIYISIFRGFAKALERGGMRGEVWNVFEGFTKLPPKVCWPTFNARNAHHDIIAHAHRDDDPTNLALTGKISYIYI